MNKAVDSEFNVIRSCVCRNPFALHFFSEFSLGSHLIVRGRCNAVCFLTMLKELGSRDR